MMAEGETGLCERAISHTVILIRFFDLISLLFPLKTYAKTCRLSSRLTDTVGFRYTARDEKFFMHIADTTTGR